MRTGVSTHVGTYHYKGISLPVIFVSLLFFYNVLERQLINNDCAGQNDMVHVIIAPSQPINVIMNDFVLYVNKITKQRYIFNQFIDYSRD